MRETQHYVLEPHEEEGAAALRPVHEGPPLLLVLRQAQRCDALPPTRAARRMRADVPATANEMDVSEDETQSEARTPIRTRDKGKQKAGPSRLVIDPSGDPPKTEPASQATSPQTELPTSEPGEAEMQVDDIDSPAAVAPATRGIGNGNGARATLALALPVPMSMANSMSGDSASMRSGQTTETDEDVRARLAPPSPSPPPRPLTAAGQRRAKFERLRQSRDKFFEKMNGLTASENPDFGEETLDELYVLAMTWRTHEDLVWPTELR